MNEQSNFIKTIIEKDYNEKKHEKIITRFPPEPNGYLHIGHARAIIINFELAKQFDGYTNLRFDDTNPEKEDIQYVDSIIDDIKWLGYNPHDILYASDYFDIMYEQAIHLIKKGLAYVCDDSHETIVAQRGDIIKPGVESIYRNRTIDENLKLFIDMKDGLFQTGSRVLRAKIDMKSPNMNMRDPIIYRISNDHHFRQKDKWHIYPLYDFAHPIEDAIENISHSLCSLEFEDHRPLYDWVVKNSNLKSVPRQIEFGKLNIENTILGKRYLRKLVEDKKVLGWDDPRMPTLKGLRRRGYRPNAIRNFILNAGLSKTNASVSEDMFQHFVREDLQDCHRLMAVKDPLKVIITNYPSDEDEELEVDMSYDNSSVLRKIHFGKELFIEREDFLKDKPNKHYKRLYLNGEVRLMHAYFIKCNDIIYNSNGSIKEIHATYDINTKSGSDFKERKPNGTIHFVSAKNSKKALFREFLPLVDENNNFNENSIIEKQGYVENYLEFSKPEDKYQFIRLGYYNTDYDSNKSKLIFNEIVSLKSSYKK